MLKLTYQQAQSRPSTCARDKEDLFLLHYTLADIHAAAAEIAKTAGASTQSTTHSTDNFGQFLSPSLPYADRKKFNAALINAQRKVQMGLRRWP